MLKDSENWTRLKKRLAESKFRSRFELNQAMVNYCRDRGEEVIRQHCMKFVRQRLAPAYPENDGKQTPWNGHPCFVAQHATACCCRHCLRKWHRIPEGRALSEQEILYVTDILMCWIGERINFIPVKEYNLL